MATTKKTKMELRNEQTEKNLDILKEKLQEIERFPRFDKLEDAKYFISNDLDVKSTELSDELFERLESEKASAHAFIEGVEIDLLTKERNKTLLSFENDKMFFVTGVNKGKFKTSSFDVDCDIISKENVSLLVLLMAKIGYKSVFDNALSIKKQQEGFKEEGNEKFDSQKLYDATTMVNYISGSHICNNSFFDVLESKIDECLTNIIGDDGDAKKEYLISCESNVLKALTHSIGFNKVEYEVFEGVNTLVALLKDYVPNGKENYSKRFHEMLNNEIFFNLRVEMSENPLFEDFWIKDKATENGTRFSRQLFMSSINKALTADKNGKEKVGEVKKEVYFTEQIMLYMRKYSR